MIQYESIEEQKTLGKILSAAFVILVFLSLTITPLSRTAFAQETRKSSDEQNKQSTLPERAGKPEIYPLLKADIIDKVKWDEHDNGNLTLFVPLFGKQLPFVLFTPVGTTPEVTDKMTATINDVLALQPENLDRVKELLWEECNFSFQVADYGVEAEPGETPLQAHLREFGISNPDDAYKQSDIQEIHISDEFNGRYAEVKVETGSGNYVSIIIKNGRIIDFDDDGTYLGWFDEDEQYIHKKRQKVIGE